MHSGRVRGIIYVRFPGTRSPALTLTSNHFHLWILAPELLSIYCMGMHEGRIHNSTCEQLVEISYLADLDAEQRTLHPVYLTATRRV